MGKPLIATIDIGTNSVRLLIAKINRSEIGIRLEPVLSQLQVTRLGEGVDTSRRLSSAAIGRTCDALIAFKQVLNDYPVEKLVLIATSAVRDGINRQDLFIRVKELTGWDIKVLSGEEEAQASFLGAINSLQLSVTSPEDRILVMDIGGGSTELIVGTARGEILASGTSQVGAVRMREKYITQQPLLDNELENLLTEIRLRALSLVQKNHMQMDDNFTLAGVGGTITTLATLHLGLDHYDPAKISGTILTKTEILKWLDYLAGLSEKEIREIPGMGRGREDIIVVGAAITAVYMESIGAEELLVSDGDLLQGIWHFNY